MAMRFGGKNKVDRKTKKLCSGFSSLEEKDQEYMFGILQALLFAALKIEAENDDTLQIVTHEKGEIIE